MLDSDINVEAKQAFTDLIQKKDSIVYWYPSVLNDLKNDLPHNLFLGRKLEISEV
jgi:hypothetical protein